MPRKKQTTPTPEEPMSRKAILEALFDAQARAYLDILRNTPRDQLKGSTLREIRTFLDQNGISLDSLGGVGIGTEDDTFDLSSVPIYSDAPLPMPNPSKGLPQGSY